MHAFQFKVENSTEGNQDHAPMGNLWWLEGQATYWGIESTKANYNLTNAEIEDEFKRVGDHNWFEHYTDLNRSITIGWGGSYSDYMGSYLFMKWISETFGEDKLKEIFDKAKDNFGNDSEDVSPEDAAADVLVLPCPSHVCCIPEPVYFLSGRYPDRWRSFHTVAGTGSVLAGSR